MRRVGVLLACIMGFYSWCMQVPATAWAGFDSPTHIAGPIDRAKDAVNPVDRCPVLSNPIECGHVLDGGRDRDSGDHGVPTHHDPAHDGRSTCARDRDAYMYHHWDDGPRSCHVYAEDRAYHRGMARVGIKDDAAEGLERFVSLIRSWFATPAQ